MNRSSVTTDRLVNLGRMAMHPKRLASISDISVLKPLIQAAQENKIIVDWNKEGYF